MGELSGGSPPPRRPLLLVDAASLYFRAFYALPKTIVDSHGQPVGAVYGFIDAIAALASFAQPAGIVCCMDADWRPAFRVSLVPSYKAHRAGPDGSEAVPADLAAQVPLVERILAAIGIPTVGVAGFEADDVIASLARRWEGPVDIATGDRDLFQLVDDSRDRRVLFLTRGFRAPQVVDDAYVRARYGIPASRYADFAVLRGDPSDGLPGVPGIGEQTAARLVAEFGSLDGVLAAAHDNATGLAARLRGRILASADYIEAARAVVVTRDDVPVPPTSELMVGLPDPDLASLSAELGVSGPVGRLLEVLASLR
ncbi:MAG: 5'-3' exonuclease [Acidothermus sp.]|nr:5'-3' exonuclease [Acidothermus sp.]MCL6538022.1 5'-3' exonuclease [Acidothermus sp.]